MTRARHKRVDSKGILGLPTMVAGGSLVVAVAAAGVLLALGNQGHRHSPTRLESSHQHRQHTASHHSASTTPQAPLQVTSISPAGDPASVAFAAPIRVRFSEALSKSSPLPTLSPSVPGSWDRLGKETLEFLPWTHYLPYAKETVIVPASTTTARGARLGHTVTSHFTVRGGSVLRLQELLAETGYLPVSFKPSGSGSSRVTTAATPPYTTPPSAPSGLASGVSAAPAPAAVEDYEPSATDRVPVVSVGGTFSWRYKNIPTSLAALWAPGADNAMTEGAVMAFEAAHGLATDGTAGPAVWAALLKAVAKRQLDRGPYNYVYVSMGSPEFVTVWSDGANVFETLANTGIPQSPTQPGTWPVYARYVVTTMSGYEPNGQYYSDPGIPWTSYFHGGDALHGFIRAQYGFPQSLGCVEMPFASAHTVWPYTPLGTLVTVA